MTQRIVIQGDLVQLVDETITKSIALSEWLPSIESRPPMHLPVLPRATRGIWYDPSAMISQKLVILMEMEPQTITMDMASRQYRLAIPWTRFVFTCSTVGNVPNTLNWRMDDYKIFWSKLRYTDATKEDMIPALLPNVYRDGRICFGSTGVNGNMTLADRLDATVNRFYSSVFNRDLDIRFPSGTCSTWRRWETASARDPMVWMNWPELADGDTIYDHYSWQMLTAHEALTPNTRLETVVAPDGIPPLAIGATFGHAAEWWNALTPVQRTRLSAAIANNPQTPVTEPETGEEEEEV